MDEEGISGQCDAEPASSPPSSQSMAEGDKEESLRKNRDEGAARDEIPRVEGNISASEEGDMKDTAQNEE